MNFLGEMQKFFREMPKKRSSTNFGKNVAPFSEGLDPLVHVGYKCWTYPRRRAVPSPSHQAAVYVCRL